MQHTLLGQSNNKTAYQTRRDSYLKNWARASELQSKAKDGDISIFQNFACYQVVIDAEHPQLGGTPLFLAALNNHLEFIEKLLSFNASLDYQTHPDINLTPLMACISKSHREGCQLLLDRGALAFYNEKQQQAIMVVAENNQLGDLLNRYMSKNRSFF